jgi:histidinol dehydrogenase
MTVTFGDKSAGPSHIHPTRRAAQYTGGLNVPKSLKQLAYQELTSEAVQRQGELSARISRYEGKEYVASSIQFNVDCPDVAVFVERAAAQVDRITRVIATSFLS